MENRAAHRADCPRHHQEAYLVPGLSENISGVILHTETLYKSDAQGNAMVDVIAKYGMLAGIKVDKAYNKKGKWETETNPPGHPV